VERFVEYMDTTFLESDKTNMVTAKFKMIFIQLVSFKHCDLLSFCN